MPRRKHLVWDDLLRPSTLSPSPQPLPDGFHSRKIINLPQTPGAKHRYKVVLLKFRSYPTMRKWIDSAELAEWIARGKSIGLSTERDLSNNAVGSVDLSQFAASTDAAKQESADCPASPPKWKLAMLIEFFVFFTVWQH